MNQIMETGGVASAAKSPESTGHLRQRFTPKLIFHLAESENLKSILEQGLMSTAKLLALHGLHDQERRTLLRTHRPTILRSRGIIIRDQAPMPPKALAPALDDGMKPGDWYALVNEHVFFWLDRERMHRHSKACKTRPQYVLTFDASRLLDGLGDYAFVSPINSGNARRKPARRGSYTLVPYRTWAERGWPTGRRNRPPVECLFRSDVPVRSPYLVGIERL